MSANKQKAPDPVARARIDLGQALLRLNRIVEEMQNERDVLLIENEQLREELRELKRGTQAGKYSK